MLRLIKSPQVSVEEHNGTGTSQWTGNHRDVEITLEKWWMSLPAAIEDEYYHDYYWRASEASETLSGVYRFELMRYV